MHPLRGLLHGHSGLRLGHPEEIAALAEFRGETSEQFAAKFVRRVKNRYSLIEKPRRRLHFLGQGSRLHCLSRAARSVPDLAVLAGKCGDAKTIGTTSATICPGSGQGRLYTVDEIVSSIAKTPE